MVMCFIKLNVFASANKTFLEQKWIDFSKRYGLHVSYKKDAKNSRKLTEFMLIFILSNKNGSDRIEALIRKAKTS